MHIYTKIPQNKVIAIVKYGSHVYGTNTYQSDNDYIVIVKDGTNHDDQYILHDGDYNVFSETHFQQLLNDQSIIAIEAFFTPSEKTIGNLNQFTYAVNKAKLRENISRNASNSFVKCKKKLTVETNEERIGVKSLFHSLRMLTFGIQLAETGRITDFSEANHYLNEINEIGYNWDKLKEKFQPIYNSLSTKFREVAPK